MAITRSNASNTTSLEHSRRLSTATLGELQAKRRGGWRLRRETSWLRWRRSPEAPGTEVAPQPRGATGRPPRPPNRTRCQAQMTNNYLHRLNLI